jgi:hypothetical protein
MVPRNIHQTRQGKTKTKPTFRETLRSETIAPEKLFIFFLLFWWDILEFRE